jgi:hypothetical protein
MAERAAFALKERADEDSVGAVFVSDAGDLNVREALASGDSYGREGVIVTDDPAEIEALDRVGGLKRVSLQDAEKAPQQSRQSQRASTGGDA